MKDSTSKHDRVLEIYSRLMAGEIIRKEELEDCFPEFSEYIGTCRFTGCAHLKDKGCAILAAVERGDIARSRHESYESMYMEVKDFKEWDKK